MKHSTSAGLLEHAIVGEGDNDLDTYGASKFGHLELHEKKARQAPDT